MAPVQVLSSTHYRPYPPPTSNAGWTDPVPTTGVTIYCSSSGGNDSNNGLTPATAVQTIAHARTLLTVNHPDWLLLKRGDTFVEPLGIWTTDGTSSGVPLSGKNSNERMVIWAYGTGPRPIIKSGTTHAFEHRTIGGSVLNYVYILGLDLWIDGFVSPFTLSVHGVYLASPANYVHVEDCNTRLCKTALYLPIITGNKTHITYRRNQVNGVRGTGAMGICMNACNNFLIEENALASITTGHGIYGALDAINGTVRLNQVSDVTTTDNAIRMNGGGIVDRNVVMRCSNGIQMGNHYDAGTGEMAVENGVPVSCTGNLTIEMPLWNTQGFQYRFENVSSGTMDQNLALHATANPLGRHFWLYTLGNTNIGTPCGIHNFTMTRNRCYDNWPSGGGPNLCRALRMEMDSSNPPTRFTNVTINNNDFQEGNMPTGANYIAWGTWFGSSGSTLHAANNRFWMANGTGLTSWFFFGSGSNGISIWNTVFHDNTSSVTQVPYPNPSANIGSYMASIGLTATTDAYIAALQAQSRTNWDTRLECATVMPYFQAAFNA